MIPRILDMLFLSAPHLAGDDVRQRSEERRRYRFYPRHPLGWRLAADNDKRAPGDVSTHATLAGGDTYIYPQYTTINEFLSTPPSRVATGRQCPQSERRRVSIHATLAGGDTGNGPPQSHRHSFYPRHPRGWRLPLVIVLCYYCGFYPRHPRGWRRGGLTSTLRLPLVSIHATLAGGDFASMRCAVIASSFYPRHPRGWRPKGDAKSIAEVTVSIHATLAGGDAGLRLGEVMALQFLSTPPSRVAT